MPKRRDNTLAAYTKQVTLQGGAVVTLKPMGKNDADALLRFFSRVPEEDRYYLKEDVTSRQVISRWASGIDYQRALPMLAWVNGRVIADGTLHRTRAPARRHVGEIRVVVDPEFRGKGMGTAMIRELASIANEDIGLERLLFLLVAGKEDAAINAAAFAGFKRVGVLPGHAKDMDGTLRAIVVMEMQLSDLYDWQY